MYEEKNSAVICLGCVLFPDLITKASTENTDMLMLSANLVFKKSCVGAVSLITKQGFTSIYIIFTSTKEVMFFVAFALMAWKVWIHWFEWILIKLCRDAEWGHGRLKTNKKPYSRLNISTIHSHTHAARLLLQPSSRTHFFKVVLFFSNNRFFRLLRRC